MHLENPSFFSMKHKRVTIENEEQQRKKAKDKKKTGDLIQFFTVA